MKYYYIVNIANISGDLQSTLILYTCTSVCPSLSLQYSDAKQGIAPQSRWKLYTIYKDKAISLDQRLFALFQDAISLCLYYSDQIDSSEIANYNVRIASYMYSHISKVFACVIRNFVLFVVCVNL